MDTSRKIQQQHLIAIALVALTIAAYWRVLGNDFVNYDDQVYVTDNRDVQKGVTLGSISWAFTTGHGANWHPLTWISLMIDYEIFGLNAWGYHLTSLLFHVLNTLLLFAVFNRMTKVSPAEVPRASGTQAGIWQSAFVAAVFALHPLHVESVAWVAERKDVLSTFFWMLTMLAYTRYVERPDVKRYLLVGLFLALGLMAKPMLVTLPLVLLLLDYWPLGRIQFAYPIGSGKQELGKPHAGEHWKSALPRLVKEKLPLIALVIGSSVATFIAQQQAGAVARTSVFTIDTRIANALVSYARYIGKTVWPEGLAVFYPYSTQWPAWQLAGAAVMLIGITVLVLRALKTKPYLPVGWLWYVGTLVPVIGLVQVGSQSIADRYMYVPMIGLLIVVAWGIPHLVARWRSRKVLVPAAAGLSTLALFAGTWIQVGYWRDSVTLMAHAAEVTTGNWIAHSNLALSYSAQGKLDQAIAQFTEALRIHPGYAEAQHGMGLALAKLGRVQEAIPYYEAALRIEPNFGDAHNNLGAALASQRKTSEALEHYTEALRIKPDFAEAHNNLGSLLAQQGKIDEAIEHFNEALRLKPDYADARNNLRVAQGSQGKTAEAMAQYSEALKRNPRDAEAHFTLGKLLADQGRIAEAGTHYTEALRFKPDYVEARVSFAALLARQGRNTEAISHYREALRWRPNDAELQNEFGVALGKQGKFAEAIQHLTEAVRLNPDYADARNNLGIALAVQGRTSEAMTQFSEAVRINPNHWSAHFNLGVLHARQGKIAEAITQYSEALRIKPDYAEAKAELEKALQVQRSGQPRMQP